VRSILTNKTLQFTLADTNHVICVRRACASAASSCGSVRQFLRARTLVSLMPSHATPAHAHTRSHTSKQNTVLRADVAPQRCAAAPAS
jgi:hypothetical protein